TSHLLLEMLGNRSAAFNLPFPDPACAGAGQRLRLQDNYRQTEVRLVEDVKHRSPDTEAQLLLNLERIEEAHVEIDVIGATVPTARLRREACVARKAWFCGIYERRGVQTGSGAKVRTALTLRPKVIRF